jgi:RNA polymerase sigma factor (sigma-70 family)
MPETTTQVWTDQASDADLIHGVRTGDRDAYRVLFERHGGAARRVAFAYTSASADVDDIVSDAFEAVLRALQDGNGPTEAFRAYLFTVIRRTARDLKRRTERTSPCEDMAIHDHALAPIAPSSDPAIAKFEHTAVAEAFASLPERWQIVLWHTEIEKQTPAEIAPGLGLTPNGVAALAYRAREALRQAYLQEHLAAVEDTACLSVFQDLAGFVRGSLTRRDLEFVTAHLRVCQRCGDLVAELEDVNAMLR